MWDIFSLTYFIFVIGRELGKCGVQLFLCESDEKVLKSKRSEKRSFHFLVFCYVHLLKIERYIFKLLDDSFKNRDCILHKRLKISRLVS